ncbi:MAG: hypothetical protein AAGK78_05290 [Planctomycetota bacterium]
MMLPFLVIVGALAALLTAKLWANLCEERLSFATYEDAVLLKQECERSVSEATGLTAVHRDSPREDASEAPVTPANSPATDATPQDGSLPDGQ